MNISGHYVIKSGGKTIATYENMLTDNALLFINKYLSGQVNYWSDTIAIGAIRENATTTSTKTLDYEIARYAVNFKSYSSTESGNKIILKATIPPESEFVCYELGVFPSRVDPRTFADHQLITNFSESFNTSGNATKWTNNGSPALTSEDVTPGVSVRSGSRRIALGTGETVELAGMSVPVPAYLSENVVSILFYSKTAVSSGSFTITFGDSSETKNLWTGSTTISTSSNTYNTASFVMDSKPSEFLSPINSVSVTFNSSTSGKIVEMDHMKFMFGDAPTPEICLISRKTSTNNTTPLFTKVFSEPMDIEYYIQVT